MHASFFDVLGLYYRMMFWRLFSLQFHVGSVHTFFNVLFSDVLFWGTLS